ncbi:MAG: c-type cytochrome [Candidatus Tectomicrobia bacterium]|nr:c-type cytochrome [Candidatus Tectomicrobia bacterium]
MRQRLASRTVMAVVVGCVVFFGVAFRAAASDERLLPDNPLAGQELFLSKGCVSCHAVLGHGGTAGPDFGKIQLSKSILGIAALMWNHSPRMTEEFLRLQRARPEFSAEEMSNLIGFLYLLNYFDPLGDPKTGAEVFKSHLCENCHAVGGAGGKVAPPLDRLKNYYTPIYLATSMWNHGAKMTESMKQRNVPLPRFHGADVADLLAFIRQMARTDVVERHYLEPGSPARGALIVHTKGCSQCHGIHKSNGGTEADARPPFATLFPNMEGPNLAKLGLRTNFSHIAGMLWTHGDGVWEIMQRNGVEVPTFSPQEMADLSIYLYFLGYADSPGNVQGGRSVFVEKGCVLCHSPHDDAKKIGPGLAKIAKNATPFEIVAAMWNHLPTMEKRLNELKFPWPRFTTAEMGDLITYLRSME